MSLLNEQMQSKEYVELTLRIAELHPGFCFPLATLLNWNQHAEAISVLSNHQAFCEHPEYCLTRALKALDKEISLEVLTSGLQNTQKSVSDIYTQFAASYRSWDFDSAVIPLLKATATDMSMPDHSRVNCAELLKFVPPVEALDVYPGNI